MKLSVGVCRYVDSYCSHALHHFGRPWGLNLSHLASIMKMSGLEFVQVDATRLGNLWIFGRVLNVDE